MPITEALGTNALGRAEQRFCGGDNGGSLPKSFAECPKPALGDTHKLRFESWTWKAWRQYQNRALVPARA
jgi:hypothetical protein